MKSFRIVRLLLTALLLCALLLSCADPALSPSDPALSPSDPALPPSDPALPPSGDPVGELPPATSDHLRDGEGNPIRPDDLRGDIGCYYIGKVMYLAAPPLVSEDNAPLPLHCIRTVGQMSDYTAHTGLHDRYAAYDDAFFAAHDLLILGLHTFSGGNRYAVRRLVRDDQGVLCLDLSMAVVGLTEDTGAWQIAIPIAKNSVRDGESVHLRELEADYDPAEELAGVAYHRLGVNNSHELPTAPILIRSEQQLALVRRWLCDTPDYDAYDAAFFADNALLLLHFEDVLTPAEYRLRSLTLTEGVLRVEVDEVLLADTVKGGYRLHQFALPLSGETLDVDAIVRIEAEFRRDVKDSPDEAAPLTGYCIHDQGGNRENRIHYVIRSPQELALFADWLVLRDGMILPPGAYTPYDDAFFAAHDLIVLPHTAGSGSLRHRLITLTEDSEGRPVMVLARLWNRGMAGTADMAYWQFLVPIAKDTVTDATPLTIYDTWLHHAEGIVTAPPAR